MTDTNSWNKSVHAAHWHFKPPSSPPLTVSTPQRHSNVFWPSSWRHVSSFEPNHCTCWFEELMSLRSQVLTPHWSPSAEHLTARNCIGYSDQFETIMWWWLASTARKQEHAETPWNLSFDSRQKTLKSKTNTFTKMWSADMKFAAFCRYHFFILLWLEWELSEYFCVQYLIFWFYFTTYPYKIIRKSIFTWCIRCFCIAVTVPPSVQQPL